MLSNINRAFIIGISLNLVYVIIQVAIGIRINSLSLLSDAGHNFLDVAGLALSLLAFKLTQSKSTEKYTYGYRKSSILVSLLNAVILLISIGAIGYESTLRFAHPQQLPGTIISIVAGLGIIINAVSALMFFTNKENDINIKSAFLHLMSDAVVSLGLVIGGIFIYYTHYYWIDPALSLIICVVIIASTWSLLKDSLRLSLDGVPANIDMQRIKGIALELNGVTEIHHIHIWAISTTQNALTAHLIVDDKITMKELQQLKDSLKHKLQHENIQHVTLETETRTTHCDGVEC